MACVMDSVDDPDAPGTSDIVPAGAGLAPGSGRGNLTFVGAGGDTVAGGLGSTFPAGNSTSDEGSATFAFFKGQSSGNDLIQDFEQFLNTAHIIPDTPT